MWGEVEGSVLLFSLLHLYKHRSRIVFYLSVTEVSVGVMWKLGLMYGPHKICTHIQ